MKNIKIPVLALIIIIDVFLCTQTNAVQKTWTGAYNNNWGNSSNWSPSGVPTNSDITYISNNPVNNRFPVISSGTYEINKLYVWDGASVSMTGGQLSVVSGTDFVLDNGSPGGIFTQSGGTLIVRDFIIQDGAVFTQTGGIINVQRDWINYGTFSSTGGIVRFVSSASSAAEFNNGLNQLYNLIIDASVDPGFDNNTGSVIYVKGDFTNNNTSLNNNSNLSLILNGQQNQNITSLSSGSTFGNLTISKTASTAFLLSSLTVSGNCSITSGSFNTDGYLFQRSSPGGNFYIYDNASLMIGGANTFPPNFSGHNITSKSIVEYNGSGQQISNETYGTLKITGTGIKTMPGGLNNIYHLYMNNSEDIRLASNMNIIDSLTLLKGKLILDNYSVNLSSSAVLSVYSDLSYVAAEGSGSLKINSVGNTQTVFPVGLVSTYNPVTITNEGVPDNFSVRIKQGFDHPPIDSNRVVKRQWTITEDIAGGSIVTLALQFGAGQWASGFEMKDPINIGRWNGTQWSAYDASIAGTGPYVVSNSSPVTSFSPFSIGNEGALPVVLSFFNSNINNRNVELFWQTENEINNSGFFILRKILNSETWENIGFVKGSGTCSGSHSYFFADKKPAPANYNYRLKQVDYNGNFEYFVLNDIVVIKQPGEFSMSQNFPNPSNPSSSIEVSLPFNSKIKLAVYDITGKEIAVLADGFFENGYHTFQFDGSAFSSGIYFYKLVTNGFTQTRKLVLVK